LGRGGSNGKTMRRPCRWVPPASAIGDWVPPLLDPQLEAELQSAAKEPLGAEVEAEVEAAEGIGAVAEEDSSQVTPLLLAAPLAVLARVADTVTGCSDESGQALVAVASACPRLFCACHVALACRAARRVERLDLALRFRGHPDFQPAAVELDDVAVDLEAAVDVYELEASQLRALMAQRAPSFAAQEAARALFTLLVDGRPSHVLLSSYSGIWGSDRMVLDPSVLLPLIYSRNPQDAPKEAITRLRAKLCQLRELVTPANILAAKSVATSIDDGSTAASALLQWAWLQVASREILGSSSRSVRSRVRFLECQLLLQPEKARVRLERRRELAQKALEKVRSDPLRAMLIKAWLDRRPVPRRRLVQVPETQIRATQSIPQHRLPSATEGRPRRGPFPPCLQGQRSLPALPQRPAQLQTSVSPTACSGHAANTAASSNLPSRSNAAAGWHSQQDAMAAWQEEGQVGQVAPVRARAASTAALQGHVACPAASCSGAVSSTAVPVGCQPRRSRGSGSSLSMRKALGLPDAQIPAARNSSSDGSRDGDGGYSRSRSSGASSAKPNIRPQSSSEQRRPGAKRLPSGPARPLSSAEKRRTPQSQDESGPAVGTMSSGVPVQQRPCAWAWPQPASRPSSAPLSLPFAPPGIPWVTPMR